MFQGTFIRTASVLMLASHACAEPYTYQGFLTESDLPATGFYDFEVSTYNEAMPAVPPPDDPVLPLGTETFDAVLVRSGVFTLVLDLPQAAIDAHSAGEPVYLDIGVRPDDDVTKIYTRLTPRARVRPSPFAAFARLPLATLQSAFDAGSTVLTLPGMRFEILGEGDSLFETPLYINRTGSNTTIDADLSLIPGDQGGRLILRDRSETLVNIAPDPDNTGGFVSISRGNGTSGVIVDGNFEDSGSPRVTVTGANSTTVIDASVSGTDSVDLPPDAIDATEIFNEPGVATDRATPNITLPHQGDLQIAATRAITVPDAGYILVTGSMETLIVATPDGAPGVGVSARIDYGISTTGTSIANGMDYTYIFESPPLTSPVPGDLYTLGNTLPFTDVIEVDQAGTLTISAVARFSSPNLPEPVCTVRDVNINLVYLPTAYGLVAREPNPSPPDHAYPPNYTGIADLIAEHRAERQRDQRRHAEQLRATRQRLADLEAKVQQLADPD